MRAWVVRRNRQPTKTIPFRDSTALLTRPGEFRAQAQQEGVLYFAGLLDAASVLRLRHDIAQVLRRYDFLKADATDDRLIADVGSYEARMDREGECGTTSVTPGVYRDIQHLQSFHALSHHPSLLRLYELLLDDEVLVHPRIVARVRVPSIRNHETPPHQDFIFNQGTTETWTAWIPVGDCPIELGGLSVLMRSHTRGILDYSRAPGAGGVAALLAGMDTPWLQGDYRAGDVITFNSQCVHKSLPNRTNLIRLSVDFRYQSRSAPVVEASLRPHLDVSTWDEIYSGWDEDFPRYYWQATELLYSAWLPVEQWVRE